MRRQPSIFIIEPRQSVRTFVEMTLSQERMRVFSAVNLSSALLQLRVLQPDLIIVGMGWQELDPEAAFAQIHALSAAPLLLLVDGSQGHPSPHVADTLPYALSAGQLCVRIARLLGGHANLAHAEPA